MTRRNHGADWTLLYFRGRQGQQEAVAQLPLNAQTSLEHLRTSLLPDLLRQMSRRHGPWRVMFLDDDDDAGFTELWERPEAAGRVLRAAHAWLLVCADSDLSDDVALRLLHTHTFHDLCACLLGHTPTFDPASPPVGAVSHALALYIESGARPPAL